MQKLNTKLEDLFTNEGYDIYFENVDLENELLSNLHVVSAEKIISRYSIMSSGHGPLAKYLDYVVKTINYLNEIANNKINDAGISDVLKCLDVSDSLKYLLGDGLDEVIDEIEKEYNSTLEMLEQAAPFLKVNKRYPFTKQMKGFCRMYLAHSLKPIAKVMIEHQAQIKKTVDAFNKYAIGKKNALPFYLVSKIAGHFVGGMLGSLAITALFSSMNLQKERQIGYELGVAHQTWYRIQTGDFHQTLAGSYSPRLYNLYLSLIGGLLLKVNKDLNCLGLEIKGVYPQCSEIQLSLNMIGNKQIKDKIEKVLASEYQNEEEIFELIHVFSQKSYYIDLLDEKGNLFIERLYVRYLYLQACSLLHNGTFVELPSDLPPVLWKGKRSLNIFTFLEDENYKAVYEMIIDAFDEYPVVMVGIYRSIVELNHLHDYADKSRKYKILPRSVLSDWYVIFTILNLKKVPEYYLENGQDLTIQSLIEDLEEPEETKRNLLDLYEHWISIGNQNEKKSLFSKLVKRLTQTNSLEEEIKELNYCKVEKLIISGERPNRIFISKDLVNLDYRSLLKLICLNFTAENIEVDSKAIEDIIDRNDCECMHLLLNVGLNPFLPLNESYILAEAINSGTSEMVYVICNYFNQNIDGYKSFLSKLNKDQISPYYRLYMGGLGHWANKFQKLVTLVPVEQREREFTLALSCTSDCNPCDMYSVGYDPKFMNYTNREESFIHALYSGPNYGLINAINKKNPELLRATIGDKTILRHIYELGYIDMADHFHEILDVHEIGKVYVDDFEEAVYSFNENYLILLKDYISNTEEILTKLSRQAMENSEWPIVEMIKRVLKNN